MKTKIFIVLATVCVFSSCILQPEKSYIYLDNDSDNIVFEVSVKNGNGKHKYFSSVWTGFVVPYNSKMIEVPEGNYYVRIAAYDDLFELKYYKTAAAYDISAAKPLFLTFDGTEILIK